MCFVMCINKHMHRVQEKYIDFSLAEDLFLWPSWRDTDITDQKRVVQQWLVNWDWLTCELIIDRTATL